jgi:hypothetical protein
MPYKQSAGRFNLIIHDRVNEEVERLLDARFIRPYRYVEWISNIVPVKKKNTDKIQICIDFHNLNNKTPKDEYSMSIVNMLINNASKH